MGPFFCNKAYTRIKRGNVKADIFDSLNYGMLTNKSLVFTPDIHKHGWYIKYSDFYVLTLFSRNAFPMIQPNE